MGPRSTVSGRDPGHVEKLKGGGCRSMHEWAGGARSRGATVLVELEQLSEWGPGAHGQDAAANAHSLGLIPERKQEGRARRPSTCRNSGPEAWSGDKLRHEQDQKEVE